MSIEFYQRGSNGEVQTAPFERFQYPAGEQSVRLIDPVISGDQIAYVQGASAEDLVALILWANLVTVSGLKKIAFIPYLPGARDDHGLHFGAGVYADLINRAGLDQVICFDPHSMKMPDLIDNCWTVDAAPLTADVLRKLTIDVAGVIIPDAGAVERSTRIADLLGAPTFQAWKHRDPATGKLSQFDCEPLPDAGVMLVADDICDGGGTFKGLAAAAGIGRDRLVLWVSHGVFSVGAYYLTDYYSRIITTDSFPPLTGVPAIHTPLKQYLFDQAFEKVTQ